MVKRNLIIMANKKHRFQTVQYEMMNGQECNFANGELIEDYVALEAYLISQLIKQAEIISPLKTKPSERLLKIILLLRTALDEVYKLQHESDGQVFNLNMEKECFPHLIEYIQKKASNEFILLDENFIEDILNEYDDHSVMLCQKSLEDLEK